MRQLMKAYAATVYDKNNPLNTNYVKVNIPDFMPTVPKDDKTIKLTVGNSYFVNSNYPITQGIVETVNYLELPLVRGTKCPTYFDKNTPFLLVLPTFKIEEGYLIYI